MKGEAVAVDLAEGQVLFALLKTGAIYGDMAGLSMTALDPQFKYDIVESAERISRRVGMRSPAEVPPTRIDEGYEMGSLVRTEVPNYPMLVTFSDIADPASVKQVDPANLAASFGPGVKLKRITAEITDDSVTTGIEKRLGWLAQSIDGGLDPALGVTARPTFAQQLGFLDFRRK